MWWWCSAVADFSAAPAAAAAAYSSSRTYTQSGWKGIRHPYVCGILVSWLGWLMPMLGRRDDHTFRARLRLSPVPNARLHMPMFVWKLSWMHDNDMWQEMYNSIKRGHAAREEKCVQKPVQSSYYFRSGFFSLLNSLSNTTTRVTTTEESKLSKIK